MSHEPIQLTVIGSNAVSLRAALSLTAAEARVFVEQIEAAVGR